MKNNLVNILEKWGKGRRVIPGRNDELKEIVVSSFKTDGKMDVVNNKPWFSLGLFGAAALTALVLLVNNPYVQNFSAIQTSKVLNLGGGAERPSDEIGKVHESSEEIPAYSPKPGNTFQDNRVNSNSGELRVPSSTQGTPSDTVGTMPAYNDNGIVEKRTSGWEGGVNLPVYPGDRSVSPVPLNDNREFLKYYYSATVKTRNVGEISGRLQTVIRGYGGRVDSVSSGEKFGSISFVVPKKSLETFKVEVTQIAGAKFIVENIASQNYLSDKRNIEVGIQGSNSSLDQLKRDRESSQKNHSLAVRTINDGINSLSSQISQVRTDIASGRGNKNELEAWLIGLEKQKSGLITSLNEENARYTQVKNRLDSQINSFEQSVKDLNKQDAQLIDNVETVNGTLILNWISIWSLLNIYTNGFWLPGLLVVFAIIALFISRRSARRSILQSSLHNAE